MKPLPKLIALLLLILVVGAGVAILTYYGYYLREYREVAYDFEIRTGVIGLNADYDALHFGGIPPNGLAEKRMTVTPAHDGRLVIIFKGGGSSYVSADPSSVDVKAGEPLEVIFRVTAPADAPLGNYSGVAKFYFYR